MRLGFACQFALWPPLIWISRQGLVPWSKHSADALTTVSAQGELLVLVQVVVGALLLLVARATRSVWCAWLFIAVPNAGLLYYLLWSAAYYV